jgi:SNF2 family DNA or RNA helicase
MNMNSYQYKTEPRAHQREILERTAELKHHALFLEMGCGKTKVMLDNISYLYEKGDINGALIIAPNGVDLNWVTDEIPAHLPERILEKSRIMRFSSKKSKTKYHKEEVKWNRTYGGLSWLIMSYDAVMTLEGKEAALLFLEQREAFYVLDESVSIKTPGAKRTMRIVRTAYRAKYRRILDGYPTPKGAFDMYSQLAFLDNDFWKQHGWDNFAMFKSYFGVFETAFGKGQKEFEKLIGFAHLEELNQLIAPISTRLLKQDVLDLPPKIYHSRYFELSPKQREMYDQMEEEYRIWVNSETLVTANMAMVRELKLQQISCGYLPVGEGEPIHMIEGKNPRLDLLEEFVENNEEKTIIWCRYKMDIALISEMLRKKNNRFRFVTYTGDTDDDDRIRAKQEFQKGDALYFLATPAAAGIGLTLHSAKNAIYYSNSYNLRHRKQSEDRAHRDGLKHSINIIDLLGYNTRDKKIMLNLCGKMDTGDVILGDAPSHDLRSQLKNWVENDA